MKTLVCEQVSDGDAIKRFKCHTARSITELVFRNTIHGWVVRAYRAGNIVRLSPAVNDFAKDKLATYNS